MIELFLLFNYCNAAKFDMKKLLNATQYTIFRFYSCAEHCMIKQCCTYSAPDAALGCLWKSCYLHLCRTFGVYGNSLDCIFFIKFTTSCQLDFQNYCYTTIYWYILLLWPIKLTIFHFASIPCSVINKH